MLWVGRLQAGTLTLSPLLPVFVDLSSLPGFPHQCARGCSSALHSSLCEGSLHLTPLPRFYATLLYSGILCHILAVSSRTFKSPQKKALYIGYHLPLLLPTTSMMPSLWICLFWRFLVPGHKPVEHVAFVSGFIYLFLI